MRFCAVAPYWNKIKKYLYKFLLKLKCAIKVFVATGTQRLRHRDEVGRPQQHRDPLKTQAHVEDMVKLSVQSLSVQSLSAQSLSAQTVRKSLMEKLESCRWKHWWKSCPNSPSPQEVRRTLMKIFVVSKRRYYNFRISPWHHWAQKDFFPLTNMGKETSLNQRIIFLKLNKLPSMNYCIALIRIIRSLKL